MKVMLWIMGAILAGCIALMAWVIHHEIVEPDAGRVTSKDYSPAYVTTTCSGNPLICTRTHHPECYRIVYHASAEDWGDECVSSSRYEEVKIGDWFAKG